MTITTTDRLAGPFRGDNETTEWPFDFVVYDKSHLRVVLARDGQEYELIADSDFEVVLNDNQQDDPGGFIRYPHPDMDPPGSPLTHQETLVITTAAPAVQTISFRSAGGFRPQTVEQRLDYLTMLVQQLMERMKHVPEAGITDTANLSLGTAAQRAQRFLGFNEDGDAVFVATPAIDPDFQDALNRLQATQLVAGEGLDGGGVLSDGLVTFELASHTHNASDINAGTLADARLPPNVARRNAYNEFTQVVLKDAFELRNDAEDARLRINITTGGRIYFAPWYNGAYNFNREFGFDPSVEKWYVEGGLTDASVTQSSVKQHEAALSIGWGQITGKPSTFPPASHTHSAADITTGTLADARLSDNVPLKNAPNVFTVQQTIQRAGGSPTLTVERVGNTVNAVIETKTTSGSVYFGNSNGSTFAIGASNNLTSSPWVSVSGTEVELNADLLDFNGDADISGSLTVGGAATFNGTATFKSGVEYRRQAISSGDQPTEPQEYLSFVWEEGDQNLGEGEGIRLAMKANMVTGPAPGVDFEFGNIQFRKGSSNDGSMYMIYAVQLTPDSDGTPPRDVLTIDGFTGEISGNGSGLTSLNASNLSSGTVPDGVLSDNVPLKNAPNVFTAQQTFKSGVEYRRQATSSNNQPTEPQEYLSFVWEEGNQDLGTGEGIRLAMKANMAAGPAPGVDFEFGNIQFRKGSSNDSSMYMIYAVQLTPDSNGSPPRDVLTIDGFTGEVIVDSLTEASDARLKSDLRVIEGALDKVRQLTGYTFSTANGVRSAGVIAQDVQRVLPEAVVEREDGMLTVGYGRLLGLLIEAIKELADRR